MKLKKMVMSNQQTQDDGVMKMKIAAKNSSKKVKPNHSTLSASVLALAFFGMSGSALADSQSALDQRASAIQQIAKDNNLQVSTSTISNSSLGANGSGSMVSSGGSATSQLPKNVQSQTDESCNQSNIQKIATNISKESKNILDSMVTAPANLAVASCLQNIMNTGVSFNLSAFNPSALINQIIQTGVNAACNAANQLLQWPQDQLSSIVNNNLSYSVPGVGQVIGVGAGVNNSGSFSSSVNGSGTGSVASPVAGYGSYTPSISVPTLPSAPLTNGVSGKISPLKWN